MEKLVRDIMKVGVPVCEMDTPLPEIAKIMVRDGADAVVVMDEEDGPVGVVSQSDLVRAYPRNPALLAAKDVMTKKIQSLEPETPITAAANLMQDEKIHQIFIMHDHPGAGRPSAVVTMRAIVREMAGLPPDRPLTPVQKARAQKK